MADKVNKFRKFLGDLVSLLGNDDNKKEILKEKELVSKIVENLQLKEQEVETEAEVETKKETETETEKEAETETEVETRVKQLEDRIKQLEEKFSAHQDFKAQKEKEVEDLKSEIKQKDEKIVELSAPAEFPTIPAAKNAGNKKNGSKNHYEFLKQHKLINF